MEIFHFSLVHVIVCQGMNEDVEDLELHKKESYLVLPPIEVGTIKTIQPHKVLFHDLDSLSFQ